jgi:hypothetical protein
MCVLRIGFISVIRYSMLLYIKLTVRYTSHSVRTNAANIGCCYEASANAVPLRISSVMSSVGYSFI